VSNRVLYEIGRFFFMLGLATTIASFLVTVLATNLFIPVHADVASASSLSSLSSLDVNTVRNMVYGAAIGGGVFLLLGAFTSAGQQVPLTSLRLTGLATYITLYSVSYAGILNLLSAVSAFFQLVPPLANPVKGVIAGIQALVAVTLGYYLLVKVAGVPSE
jgi:hypothetical protein